ncbi:MAG: hypothetical protein ABIK09_18355 [Pseudomonadota bacterium]
MQDFIDMLSRVIFFAIIATIVLAVVTYFAYKVREFRRPRAAVSKVPLVGDDGSYLDPMLFEKHDPGGASAPLGDE